MSKTFDTQEFQTMPSQIPSLDATHDAKFDLEPDTNPHANPCEVRIPHANFPLSRRQAAKHMGISDVGLGKLIKKIEARGITLTNANDQITSEGYNLLVEYRAARDREEFLNTLEETQAQEWGQSQLVHIQSNPFSMAIETKASERVHTLRAELAEIDSEADCDFEDYLTLAAEIETEEEAAAEQDALEWELLRKKHARKWLKRRAILERDQQQILQGNVALSELKKP